MLAQQYCSWSASSALLGLRFLAVTNAALDDIERAPPGVGGRLACFNKHRDVVESAATAKHQRGQLEESGAVIVQTGDLKTSSF
jgi:hypothetical protein